MSTGVKLPYHAWVLVGDGRKAFLLRNEGDAVYPDLAVKQTLNAGPNPSTREQGTDAPGRAMHGGQRSAMEQTDWHGRSEAAFARETALAISVVCQREAVKDLIIVAPPATLAELRKALPSAVKSVITAEVNKDLTNLPTHEIVRHLVAG